MPQLGPPGPTGMDREQGDHRLFLGDCLHPLTGLASLPDKSVDHVICDPPYSTDVYLRAARVRPGAKGSNTEFISLERMGAGMIGAMSDDALRVLAEQAMRIAVRWTIVFHAFESWPVVMDAMGDHFVRAGVWAKPDATPQITGDRPSHAFEAATIGHAPTRKRWNGGGMPALWIIGTERQRDHEHPCPKPLKLMERLIADFTDPGELVCDPFAGSGTTGVACKRLGRRFIGWEKDPKYHAAAVKRIENARQQYELLPRGPRPKQSGLFPKEARSPQAKKALP